MAGDKKIATETEVGTSFESATGVLGEANWKTPTELSDIVAAFASSSRWLERVRLRGDRRWYEQLFHGPEYDVWLISWMPGQSTGFHDHGPSSGAFAVTVGSLEEHSPGVRVPVVSADKPRAFGPNYTHDVRNVSAAPAISIHAYSPPLTEMNEYELVGARLVPRMREGQGAGTYGHNWRIQEQETAVQPGALPVEDMLVAARTRLERLSPNDAYEAAKAGALLVDIRPESQRATEGCVEGAMVVERNVLEWRFDPSSSSRLPAASSHDVQIIVFCSEGYASSLAAAALQDLGLWRATDIIGGFQAWRAKGLPTGAL